jgi:hypothetical protein
MVVAATALFLTLGGTGYAASTINAKSGSKASASGQSLRNPRGPRGPRGFRGFRGPAGPQGPQGPAGADGSQLKAAAIRTVYGATVTLPVAPAAGPAVAHDILVFCDAGERVIGGGFLEPNNVDQAAGVVLSNAPAPSNPTSGWFLRIINFSPTRTLDVQASAVCVKAS